MFASAQWDMRTCEQIEGAKKGGSTTPNEAKAHEQTDSSQFAELDKERGGLSTKERSWQSKAESKEKFTRRMQSPSFIANNDCCKSLARTQQQECSRHSEPCISRMLPFREVVKNCIVEKWSEELAKVENINNDV
ncbi:uncharacterized protein MONOS_11781 [Monocercomonoides exilis]|uniref:uncharacterized protein n=1 Tax=Monocercomonoides exilis TaxID=2049356 RepID=UPI003559CC9B|nr:hypothetical protein MONOS_11781 [Monocercomonoides exilis]|eukprot:MONOS_11781.1-p1 / transcript=MONOS_11781.1 / gene=MONOS_11781 / organism=Monocercomonoides_exilis_PA203 / gene_product=unspecified product / transcript_product=unspecified product / location=Mono_scaffold00610:35008-35412(+) / protein_length=135 / sequence_SO=supercontig / SO=protein_coding / is_pseudo=false